MRIKKKKQIAREIITPTKDTILLTKVRSSGSLRVKMTRASTEKDWQIVIANANQGYSNIKLTKEEAEHLAEEILGMLREIS